MALSTLPAELLENVLKQLDTKTLLLSQRVSKQWHELIRSSPSLQAKLFFTGTSRPAEGDHYAWYESENRLERLDSDASDEDIVATSTKVLKGITLNPLLTEEILPLETNSILPASQQGQRHEAITINRLLASPKGSWRSMYISSPPVTTIQARSVFCWSPDNSHSTWSAEWHGFSVQDAAGVKMSHVVDAVLRKAGSIGVLPQDLVAGRLDHWHFTSVDCVAINEEMER
ncbi:hypothetical protein Q7P37_010222 [Cladosporium fusiforme]